MTLKHFNLFFASALVLLSAVKVSAQATLPRLEEDITRGGGYTTLTNLLK